MEELRKFFHVFFDSSIDFYALLDKKGTVLATNKNSLAKYFHRGQEPSFFTEQNFPDSSSLNSAQALFNEVKKSGTAQSTDLSLNIGGSDKYLHLGLKPIDTKSSFLVRISDISEEKFLELVWKDREEQFLIVSNFSDVGIILTDASRSPIYINQILMDLLGYSEQELVDLQFENITHPDDMKGESEMFEALIAGKRESYQLEKRFKRKDNRWVWVKLTATALHHDDGSVKYLLFAATDISRIKKVEKDLRESKRNYEALVDQSPMGIIVHQDQKVVYVNKRAMEIMKVNHKNQILGHNPVAFVHPDSLETVKQRIQSIFSTKESAPLIEETYIDLEGKPVYVEATGSPIRFNGKPASQVLFVEVTEKRRAEQNLKKEKEKAEHYLNSASSIIAVIDKAGIIERINAKGQHVLGYSADELEGENWFDKCVSPKYRETYRETFLKYLEGEDSGNYLEGMALTKDGRKRLLGWYAHFLKNDDGLINKVILSGQDITEDRLNQHLLEKSERSLKEAQSIARLGSWEWTLETGVVHISDEIKKILELTSLESNEVSPLDLFQFLVDDAKRHFSIDYEKALKGLAFEKFEYKIKTHKGREKFIEGRISKVKDSNEKVIGYKGIIQDISERKQILNQLSQSERKYRALFERNLVGVFRIDADTQLVTDCNEAFARLLRHSSPEDLIGRNINDFIRILNEENYLKKVVENGQLTNNESHIRLHTGEEIFTLENCYTIDSGIGKKYIEGTIQDITLIKKTELERIKLIDQLTVQNKDLEEFAYVVSHNLRSPVASILGLTDLARGYIEDESSVEILQRLSDTANNLDEIIKDLNFILSSRKGGTDPKENLNMEDLFNSTLRVLKEEITRTDSIIKSDFTKAPQVFAVKSYMSNIFFNLIHNAIKYRKPDINPEIMAYSYTENGSIVIQIKDNGIGLNMERAKKKLFGLYQRIHNHTEGKGMGLYLVKSQIETMGGSVEVESEEGIGSIFRIKIPAKLDTSVL